MPETIQIWRQRQPHLLDDESLTIKPPQSDQQNALSLGNEDEEFRVIASGDLSDSTDEMRKEIACLLPSFDINGRANSSCVM